MILIPISMYWASLVVYIAIYRNSENQPFFAKIAIFAKMAALAILRVKMAGYQNFE